MPIVPMFGVGFASKSPNVTAQRRVNLYLEPQRDNDKTPLAIYGTPGLTRVYDMGDLPSRGMIVTPQPGTVGDWIYTVHGNKIWIISPSGVQTLVGTINTSTGPVSMAWNGIQLIFVDGQDGWIFTPGVSALQQIVSAGFPDKPETVTFLNGYFIVNRGGTGEFYWSALFDGTSWDALSFATAESSPDNLIAVTADAGELYLLGEKTTEVWVPSGDANVWTRLGGSGVEWGLVSAPTLAKFTDGLIFLGVNRLGEAQVVRLISYQAVQVSDPEVAHAINASDLAAATGFSYMIDGHSFYQLNLPDRSYLYDALSQAWSIVSSGTQGGRHYAAMRAGLLQQPYVADYRNGRIYLLDKDAYTDDGETIVREIVGRHIFTDYERRVVHEVQIDVESGTGLQAGQGSDPQIMLQVSRDGGHTWGNELWQTMGRAGKYAQRVIWRRLGYARDWLFRFRVTDPVKVVIVGIGLKVS